MAGERQDRALGAGVAALGAAAVVGAMWIGAGPEAWGPRTVPMLGGAVMVVTGLAIMREPAATATAAGYGAWWPPLALLLLGGAYVLAMQRIGFLAATGLVAPLAFALFGVRSWAALLLAAMICPVALFLFFFRLLGVFPPYGAWFDLADRLPV